MDKAEARQNFSDTSEVLGQLAAKMESPDYCEKVTSEEYNRDLSIALEQGQKIIDTFSEIIDGIDTDNSDFKKFCRQYEKTHGA